MNDTKEKHATHTPGPWHYSEVIRGRDQYYRQIRADFKIAEVHACHSGVAGTKKGRAEDEANARLIAAAPETYEMCKLLLPSFSLQANNGHCYPFESRVGEFADKLREVLAKVEGGEG
tara:strand:- start:437 stop:790 length:354 start_codon:yes stop_codon:yes gene_type:complete